MSGRDQCYALPELQQWEAARTENYIWGDPAAIQAYGKGLDTAGDDLGAIADSLTGIDVSGFWTGAAADAFTDLKRRVTPAVRGLSDMHKDSATALNTWQQHLGVYQEDCASAITTGRNGWHLYQTTSCDNQDAQNQMKNGKAGITNAESGRDTAGRTCKSALEAAAAKADVPTAPPQQQGVPNQISTTPGQVGTAPSGREPVPFTGPIPAGQPRPYVDPANGKIVVPRPGPWAIGKQPWDYADGTPAPSIVTQPASQNPYIPSTPPPPGGPNTLGISPSGKEPIPFTGPTADGKPQYVDPVNGRIVVPAMGPYATGKRPWVYQN
jgi:Cu/Zn superoxide dismutase